VDGDAMNSALEHADFDFGVRWKRNSERSIALHRTQEGVYRFGGWQLDPCKGELLDPGGAPVALTIGECALLKVLLETPQRPLPREDVMLAIRIRDDGSDPPIEVQLLGLRRKLELDASAPKIILTGRASCSSHSRYYLFALTVDPPKK
jgi:two-component system, OmpR family, response regulator